MGQRRLAFCLAPTDIASYEMLDTKVRVGRVYAQRFTQCFSENTLAEMIALSSTVLYHGVLARAASSTALSAVESLPTEVIDEILLFAAGTSLQTRIHVQSVCRLFRYLSVLNSRFYTDLASLPIQSAAFYAHFNRAYSRGRPVNLVLDDSNINRRTPPFACLLSGAVFARHVVVQHTLPVGDVVATLVRQRSCTLLTDLDLAPVGNMWAARKLLKPLRGGENNCLSIRAPRLVRLKLTQLAVDFPLSRSLRYLAIDCRTELDVFGTADAFHARTLHSLLSRNIHLEVIDLASPVGAVGIAEGPTTLIILPSVKRFTLSTYSVESMSWLLPCLALPLDAYVSLKIGENARTAVDLPAFIGAASQWTRYHLRYSY